MLPWARLAFCLAAYLWPAYATFKALEGDNRNLEEIKKWQQYWVILGFFTAAQPAVDLFFFWVPLYTELKIGAAIYLWYPGLQGASRMYSQWLKPTLLEQEPLIDQRLAEAKGRLSSLISSNIGRLVQLLQERAAAVVQSVQNAQPKVAAVPSRGATAVKAD